MKESFPSCCICGMGANWVRTRMPNEQQMDALCQRHYQALNERNVLLASYYDVLASLPASPAEHERRTERAASEYRPQERL